MEGPQNKAVSFKCPNHSQQDVLFVCPINDWHFDLLCQTCTPIHTQNHPKRLKANLQSFPQFHEQLLKVKEDAQKSMHTKVKSIEKLLDEPLIAEKVMQQLQGLQKNLHTVVTKYFEKLSIELKERFGSFEEKERAKLIKVKENLQFENQQIQQILKDAEYLSIDAWKTAAKKIYFKEKAKIYLEEIDEILKEHQNLISEIKVLSVPAGQKVYSKVEYLLKSIITLEKNGIPNSGQDKNSKEAPKNSSGKNTGVVRKPIVPQKKKTCKNCNEEMEYLTENKKHLICKHCNNKERNYTKKTN